MNDFIFKEYVQSSLSTKRQGFCAQKYPGHLTIRLQLSWIHTKRIYVFQASDSACVSGNDIYAWMGFRFRNVIRDKFIEKCSEVILKKGAPHNYLKGVAIDPTCIYTGRLERTQTTWYILNGRWFERTEPNLIHFKWDSRVNTLDNLLFET